MININRHNYESFFLLYIDNELMDAERKAVEQFLQENPDLQSEFDAIKKTLLDPETLSFENKNSLLKSETNSFIQEDLFLLLDNELTAEKKQKTEMLISGDVTIAHEWAILQKTKLLPDTTIIFQDKHLLYKKQSAPVISLYLKRAAIAAVIIGIGVWWGIKYLGHSNQPQGMELADHNSLRKPSFVLDTTIDTNIKSSDAIASNNIINKKDIEATIPNKGTIQDHEFVAAYEKKAQKNSVSNLKNINNLKSNIIVTDNVLPMKPDLQLAANETPSINDRQYLAIEDVDITEKNVYAVNTVYETDEEISNDKILYIDEEKIKRTKIGGLFRKVKRVFERTANIKTGETLKIAGFEIAVR